MKPKHVAMGFVVAILAHVAILITHAAQKPVVKDSSTTQPLPRLYGPIHPGATMTLIAERDGVRVWSLLYKGTETLITSVGEIRRVP